MLQPISLALMFQESTHQDKDLRQHTEYQQIKAKEKYLCKLLYINCNKVLESEMNDNATRMSN